MCAEVYEFALFDARQHRCFIRLAAEQWHRAKHPGYHLGLLSTVFKPG